ncbi:unnamed protein product (plasmid) [Mycetohabitans rhizoxinica HKI 454]|uniref:Uncharacterized protein n=1 Tax=Mycetohabitans rhizoxinica (strain DSM 19002 / CIP 109453 / HKI 454) TaxID=882378 RepID=E5AVB0_MYCRK|nr:unnamed protein product [Mycetohabitans rhizoxinica HKI 454]
MSSTPPIQEGSSGRKRGNNYVVHIYAINSLENLVHLCSTFSRS